MVRRGVLSGKTLHLTLEASGAWHITHCQLSLAEAWLYQTDRIFTSRRSNERPKQTSVKARQRGEVG